MQAASQMLRTSTASRRELFRTGSSKRELIKPGGKEERTGQGGSGNITPPARRLQTKKQLLDQVEVQSRRLSLTSQSLRQALHVLAQRRDFFAQRGDLLSSAQLRGFVLRIAADEERRQRRRHVAEHRKGIQRQYEAE